MKNGFENISSAIPEGAPEPDRFEAFGVVAKRVTNRTRLMMNTAKGAHVWASMPRPPKDA